MLYFPNDFSYFAFFLADVQLRFSLVSLAVLPLAWF